MTSTARPRARKRPMALRKTRHTAPPGSPGALFAAALAERGIGKTAFGRQIGEEYYRILRWTLNREFTPRNQARAAEGLGLAPDAFNAPDAAALREAHNRRVWRAFLARPIGEQCPAEVIRVLKSIDFVDENVRPTVALYETWAAYLLGLLDESEVSTVAEHNETLDRRANPQRRTKPPK